MASAIKVR